MKKAVLSIMVFLTAVTGYNQDAKEYFLSGMKAIEENNLDDAIEYFDKSIQIKDDEFIVWYNRGIVKSWQRRYEESIDDFNQSIKLNPGFKNAYNNRGNSRQDITDYAGALADYNSALKIDSQYIDAIYNRGELYLLLNEKEKACKDFNLAFNLGDSLSENYMKKCRDTSSFGAHSILRLTVTADNDSYGFTSENPIKVGAGPKGGPANERAYLNLLRDINGKPVNYQRLGSCCPYKSDNPLGGGVVDKYEIYYLNNKGKEEKAIIFITMWDYEEPKILYGFKTVGQK